MSRLILFKAFNFQVPPIDHQTIQLRVTAARPGTVNFELDIKKEHTVSLRVSLLRMDPQAWLQLAFADKSTLFVSNRIASTSSTAARWRA